MNYESYQQIDNSIPQYFEPDPSGKNLFYPTLLSKSTLHFYNQSKGIDKEKIVLLALTLEGKDRSIAWENAEEVSLAFEHFPIKAPRSAKFQVLPKVVLEDPELKEVVKALKSYLYQEEKLMLFRTRSPKLESKAGESERDFRVRVQDVLNEKRESEIDKLKVRYASKEKVLIARLSRAKERVEKESSDSMSSMIDAGIAVIGALFGRSTPTKISRAFKKGSTILKERGDMSRAEERVVKVEDDIEALEYELEDKIDDLSEKYSIEHCEVEPFSIKARKTDILVENCAIVWRI